MPETFFVVRWPDGSTQRCYSPSLVVEEFFSPGQSYSVDDFVERSRKALTIAAERVQQKYGFACGQALNQIEQIEARAGLLDGSGVASVIVEGFER